MIICALIVGLLCIGGTTHVETAPVGTASIGWPFMWGVERVKTVGMLWERLVPGHTRPSFLFADVGVGLLIGAALGGVIGLSIRWKQRSQASALTIGEGR